MSTYQKLTVVTVSAGCLLLIELLRRTCLSKELTLAQRIAKKVSKAYPLIQPFIYKTPLLNSLPLSKLFPANNNRVFVKLESEQVTGSFKARGALNRLLTLSKSQRNKGIVIASTGNHALGIAYAVQQAANICGPIVAKFILPTNASLAKVNAIKDLGGEIEYFGTDCVETENYARKLAQTTNACYISPYNDEAIIAGQGTIALEILDQLPNVDVIFVPVGGGGLVSGIAAYIKLVKPRVRLIGCQPENDACMAASVSAGRILDEGEYSLKKTISDGTAGGIENGSITFDLCSQLVDEYICVSESEIASAVKYMLEHHHKVIEGSAGLTLAAYKKSHGSFNRKNIVLISCGSNIPIKKYLQIVNKTI